MYRGFGNVSQPNRENKYAPARGGKCVPAQRMPENRAGPENPAGPRWEMSPGPGFGGKSRRPAVGNVSQHLPSQKIPPARGPFRAEQRRSGVGAGDQTD